MRYTEEMYWFAVGYAEGRFLGWQEPDTEERTGPHRSAYKAGYDRGVADYCAAELDTEATA